MSGTGALRRLRRGAYAEPITSDLDARVAHLELLEATLRQSAPDTVASHMTAAAVHGLPLWTAMLGRVQLTRDRLGGLKQRRYSLIRGIPLDAGEIVTVDGILVTSLARTLFDLGCQLTMQQAVPVGDAALRQGLTELEIETALERGRRRHGIGRARRSLRFLDARAESPGESSSRVVFFEIGLPKPDLQVEIRNAAGRLLGPLRLRVGRVQHGRRIRRQDQIRADPPARSTGGGRRLGREAPRGRDPQRGDADGALGDGRPASAHPARDQSAPRLRSWPPGRLTRRPPTRPGLRSSSPSPRPRPGPVWTPSSCLDPECRVQTAGKGPNGWDGSKRLGRVQTAGKGPNGWEGGGQWWPRVS